MLAELEPIEQIVLQAQQLSPQQRLRLIQRITDTLLPAYRPPSTPLQFGKYQSSRMSTLKDFATAEWHPTDEELFDELGPIEAERFLALVPTKPMDAVEWHRQWQATLDQETYFAEVFGPANDKS